MKDNNPVNVYVLHSEKTDSLARFTNGDIVIYGDAKEPSIDAVGDEQVTHVTELSPSDKREVQYQLDLIELREINAKLDANLAMMTTKVGRLRRTLGKEMNENEQLINQQK